MERRSKIVLLAVVAIAAAVVGLTVVAYAQTLGASELGQCNSVRGRGMGMMGSYGGMMGGSSGMQANCQSMMSQNSGAGCNTVMDQQNMTQCCH